MIDNKTTITGFYNGLIDNLLKPFKNSDQLPRAKRLAVLYLKYCNKFAIRADVAFAQMCHETGCLQFQGIVKPDWNNFAGVGITGLDAVVKFENEDLGVIAHVAHLAWYVYPDHKNSLCARQFDPRHFETDGNHHPRFNSDVTLNCLNANWAPSQTYTDKIIYFLKIINDEKEIKPINELLITGTPATNYKVSEPPLVSATAEIPTISETSQVTNDKFDIIMQMGHIGITTGMTGTPGEMIWNCKLGAAMKPLLDEAKINYRIMGGLDWLPKVPNKAKIFLSLHCDGSTNQTASGFTLGYKPNTNQRFKDIMAMSYKAFSQLDRRSDNCTAGLRLYYMWTTKKENPKSKYTIQRVEADYYCLLEHGFYTCPSDRKWLDENIDGIAKHHIMVISKFLKDLK